MAGGLAGAASLGVLLAFDALFETSIATDEDGSSVIASIVMLVVFLVVYSAILGRLRDS